MKRRPTTVVALDWDSTLVDPASQEWLPGAERALDKLLMAKARVIVHSCRANWPAGVDQIRARLGHRAQIVEVVGKPYADVYVDNQAVQFAGDWDSALHEIWRRRR